ncbi:hypothetical protein OU800_18210 [Pseudomonas sp. GOM7]|uniref:hypothetical protein n=1 Tax=unclassified Pseudomonas TaxID=196821 RepID=UPI00227B9A0A|nr:MULTISPECIES: hypothetical protein [unclassified Pseudomonas]WAJ36531.1 hypothetical protein OU800_18210 [Pseudomonas sp. GOM7]
MDVQQANPFQPPQADLQPHVFSSGQPLYRMTAIGIGTFLGTPLAGAWLLAYNLRQLGKAKHVAMVWSVALAMLVLTTVLSFVLPEDTLTLPFAILQLLGMLLLAKQLIQADLLRHAAAGGAFLSNWRAAGIAILFFLGVTALLVGVLMLLFV